jgi:WD domain, G-beta repeat
LWDIESGELLLRTQPKSGDTSNCWGIALSPDGRLIAGAESGDSKAFAVLREITSGQEVCRFPLRGSSDTFTLAFSPDGRTLASAGYDDPTILLWNITGLAPGFGEPGYSLGGRRELLWAALADKEAAKAFRAVGELVHAPTETIPFLADKLHPTFAVPPKRLKRWLTDLDADDFDTRERASHRLAEAGKQVAPYLRRVLEGNPSPEVRRRAEKLLKDYRAAERSPEGLRQSRTLMVLEQIGTPEARAVLARLAEGAQGARLTAESKAALRRLAAE